MPETTDQTAPAASRHYLRVGVNIDADILNQHPHFSAVGYDLPLSESAAKTLLDDFQVLDAFDSHPGDGDVEYDLPAQGQKFKVFGIPVALQEHAQVYLKLIDKGPAPTA